MVASTKSLTGHSLGATGVQEAIYTLLMMQHGFVAGSANIETPDKGIGEIPVPRQAEDKGDQLRARQFLWLWRHQRHAGTDEGLIMGVLAGKKGLIMGVSPMTDPSPLVSPVRRMKPELSWPSPIRMT